MNRRPVTSSNVASIGWENDVLEVEFHSGHIYRYHDVPQGEYQALLGASSVGKMFNSAIAGQFREEKVT
jgi:hypothetical protein